MNASSALLAQYSLMEIDYFVQRIPFLNTLVSSVNGFYAMVFLLGCYIVCLNCQNNQEKVFRPTIGRAFTTIFFLIWGIFSLSGISVFLYFNF